jgi:hypothetical protein
MRKEIKMIMAYEAIINSDKQFPDDYTIIKNDSRIGGYRIEQARRLMVNSLSFKEVRLFCLGIASHVNGINDMMFDCKAEEILKAINNKDHIEFPVVFCELE